MGLFKEVKKPVIKTVFPAADEISPLRPLFVAKAPPCASGCPNGNEVRGSLVMIAQAKDYGLSTEQAFERAWNHIVERNPLPAVTGRICPHPCEGNCNRSAKDGAVALHAIERMLGDFAIARKLKLPRAAEQHKETIAVAGAGPAGLSCAYQLARRGYRVTVFESLPLPGGMLRYCIPGHRLRRNVLEAELNRLLDLGIELRCNCRAGRDISLGQLRQEYQAVFVGTGAWQGIPLKLAGEDARNVFSGIEFLQRLNGDGNLDIGGKVVVVGAGPTAIDVAHSCKRLGADVTMVGAEITAADWEIEAVRSEGVRIEAPALPVAIQTRDGYATSVRCAYLAAPTSDLSEATRSSQSEFELEANFVIVATNREPDLRGFEAVSNGATWFRADDWGRTPGKQLFAGGDNTGLGTVARAIAQGRLAAEAIDRQFRGLEPEKTTQLPTITADKMKLEWYQAAPRQLATDEEEHCLDAIHEMEWSEETVVSEAKRCMSCGMCMDCEACWMYCTPNCFVRLPKGEHCRIKLELCNGCKKCAEACPTGYIELI